MSDASRPAASAARTERRAPRLRDRALLGGVLLGIGVMAAVDEIVFHQLLQWHNFVSADASAAAIASDGVLHALELLFLAGGVVLLLDARGGATWSARAAWTGGFLGAGGFQLWDGVVDHKILRLHQVREGVDDLLPYDLAWIASGVALLAVGAVLASVRTPAERTG